HLRSLNVTAQPGLDYLYDVNGGVGGPLQKDKLWFWAAGRYNLAWELLGNNFVNLTPNTLFYAPDTTQPARKNRMAADRSVRVTWQANAKNKLNFSTLWDKGCSCWDRSSRDAHPDASYGAEHTFRLGQVTWSAPVTNRILFEARGNFLWDRTLTVAD